MRKSLSIAKEFVLDILFPKFCLSCGREEDYLCEDCFYLIDIFNRQYCPFCWPPKPVIDGKTCRFCKRKKKLNGLFCAASYDEPIVKNLINQFKYEPYIKELAKPLASLILAHLANLDTSEKEPLPKNRRSPIFWQGFSSPKKDFILLSIPLHKKKLKERGYNQAEEIGKELSQSLKISVFNNVLIKIKQTPSQTELTKNQRKKNIIGAFLVQKPEIVKNKKILLIDDVFTTGTTMEECAYILKQSGAKEVWGIVAARG